MEEWFHSFDMKRIQNIPGEYIILVQDYNAALSWERLGMAKMPTPGVSEKICQVRLSGSKGEGEKNK